MTIMHGFAPGQDASSRRPASSGLLPAPRDRAKKIRFHGSCLHGIMKDIEGKEMGSAGVQEYWGETHWVRALYL